MLSFDLLVFTTTAMLFNYALQLQRKFNHYVKEKIIDLHNK